MKKTIALMALCALGAGLVACTQTTTTAKPTTTTTTQAVTTTTTAKPTTTTTTQAGPEYTVYDGNVKVKFGDYTCPMGVNTERHWGTEFAAYTAGNSDWWFGLDYDLLETWNPNLSVDKGAVVILDSTGKMIYVAIVSEGINYVAEVKDDALVTSTLEGTDVMAGINEKVPANGLLLFGNDFGGKDWVSHIPNIPQHLYASIRHWTYEDFTSQVIFDYAKGTNTENPVRSYKVFDGCKFTFGGTNTYDGGFNTERHWGENFAANTPGNCDWFFGLSQWLLPTWNPGLRAENGVAAALDAEGHIVYMVIKGGEGINVVYEIVDGELVTSTYAETSILKDISKKIPANGALLFGNDLNAGYDYPNIPTWTYNIVKDWTAADFQANVIFNQYQ